MKKTMDMLWNLINRIDYFFFLLIAVAFLNSCNSENKPIFAPKDIIPRDSMVLLLADIHMLESCLSVSKLRNDSSSTDTVRSYYFGIFKKYHLSNQKFRKSFLYYSKKPKEMDKIYEDIMSLLAQQQSQELNRSEVKLNRPIHNHNAEE